MPVEFAFAHGPGLECLQHDLCTGSKRPSVKRRDYHSCLKRRRKWTKSKPFDIVWWAACLLWWSEWSCSQGMFGGDERVPEMRSLSRSWLLARQTIKSCGAIWQDPVVTFGAPKILWTLVALLLQLAWLPVQVVSSAHISPVMSPGLHFFAASLMVVLPTTALRSQKGYMTFMVAWHSPWWTSYHLNNSTLYFFVFCWDRRISTGRLQNQGWRFENYSVGMWRDRYGMEMLVDSWKMAQLCFVPMISFFLGRQISFQLPFET